MALPRVHVHEAYASWEGDMKTGEGYLEVGRGGLRTSYDHGSRLGNGFDTTPEELLGAAHATCFCMSLARLLEVEGFEARSIRATCEVRLSESADGSDPEIDRIDLGVTAEVPGIDPALFRDRAENARRSCTISRALPDTLIRLDVRLDN